jgi:hypothetical protein
MVLPAPPGAMLPYSEESSWHIDCADARRFCARRKKLVENPYCVYWRCCLRLQHKPISGQFNANANSGAAATSVTTRPG